jgi:hypothetical protein
MNYYYATVKADPLLNQIPGDEEEWGNGDRSPSIFNLGARWM